MSFKINSGKIKIHSNPKIFREIVLVSNKYGFLKFFLRKYIRENKSYHFHWKIFREINRDNIYLATVWKSTKKRDHPQKIAWNLLFSNLIWRKKCWFFCKKSDRLFWRLFHTVLVQYSIARNFCQKLRIISKKRYRSLQTWRPKKLLSNCFHEKLQ